MNNRHWGRQLIVDASKCNSESIRNVSHIKQFAKELVKTIDMIPYGEPRVVHFGKGPKQGNTLVQLIETSSITVHFVEATNDMYFDLFSCKDFNPKAVKDLIRLYFQPKTIHTHLLYRNA
jgi:S-adenosylmethionine/arginine decarboxylase-like enzyme